MRKLMVSLPLLLLVGLTTLASADDRQPPDLIIERMAMKLTRGVTNVATSLVELPKQTYLTIRNEGGIGYVIGPLKGVGMTAYRAFIGATETVFFLVPAPGYYNEMIDPEFVWNGWNDVRMEPQPEPAAEKKGD